MSYEVPDIKEYQWGQDNFGATSVVHYIIGPKGKVGFVRDISIDITTAMAGNTAVPEIDIGISSGDATYGRYRLGTAAGTGYGTGFFAAGNEAIPGNPPRTLSDFAGHVVLDGGPTATSGVAGGTFLTVALAGRIPASGMVVSNVVSVAAATARLTMRDPLPYNLVAGQTVSVRGVAGTMGGVNGSNLTINAISVANNTIDLLTSTLTAYTGGGIVDVVAVVTMKQATGATTTGAGYGRVTIQWLGVNTP